MINLIFDQKRLFYYSPFRFIKNLDKDSLTNKTVIEPIEKEIEKGLIKNIEITASGFRHSFLQKKLEWDSKNMGFPCYKVFQVLFTHQSFDILFKAIKIYKSSALKKNKGYYFFDIPSEDIILCQALTGNGFFLIESRLNYFYDNICEYSSKKRYPVRFATEADAELLKDVAIKMKNPYDRLHADFRISDKLADDYIGKFAYNSVLGYADHVIVPKIINESPIGFLAFNKPIDYNGISISKLVLTAIDNNKHKGWLLKLLTEAVYLLKESNVDYLTTITQTSNIAAFRTWEKFGFKLGFVTNIFVYKND